MDLSWLESSLMRESWLLQCEGRVVIIFVRSEGSRVFESVRTLAARGGARAGQAVGPTFQTFLPHENFCGTEGARHLGSAKIPEEIAWRKRLLRVISRTFRRKRRFVKEPSARSSRV